MGPSREKGQRHVWYQAKSQGRPLGGALETMQITTPKSRIEVQRSWRFTHICTLVPPGGYKFLDNSSSMCIRQRRLQKAESSPEERHAGAGKLEGSTLGANKRQRDPNRQGHGALTACATCSFHSGGKLYSLPPTYVFPLLSYPCQ